MTVGEVSGWQPAWAPARDQLRTQAERLRALVGHSISDSWIVWNLEHDSWFPDLPVVLQFEDGQQLEICWQKWDDLSITWNTVDVGITPHAWVTWPLEWRSQAHPALSRVSNHEIRQVRVTQHLFTTHSATAPEDLRSAWLTGGIWFGAAHLGLHVFNALDENGLSNERPTASPASRVDPV